MSRGWSGETAIGKGTSVIDRRTTLALIANWDVMEADGVSGLIGHSSPASPSLNVAEPSSAITIVFGPSPMLYEVSL